MASSRALAFLASLAIPAILGNLADPMLYMLGLGYGLGSLLPDVAGMPYLTFLAAGTVAYSTMNAATFEVLYSSFSRMHVQRTWDAIINAPIALDDVMLAFPDLKVIAYHAGWPDTEALIMRGGTGAKALAAIRAKIADAYPGDPLLVMTTVPYGGEGFDAPAIDTVFLAGPISYPGLLIQAVGRALRRHEGKTEVAVHDYLDASVPVLNALEPGAAFIFQRGIFLRLLVETDIQVAERLHAALLDLFFRTPVLVGGNHLAELGAPVAQVIVADRPVS